jgi:hypothetical protein
VTVTIATFTATSVAAIVALLVRFMAIAIPAAITAAARHYTPSQGNLQSLQSLPGSGQPISGPFTAFTVFSGIFLPSLFIDLLYMMLIALSTTRIIL